MTTHYVPMQASPGETATAKLFDLDGVSDTVRGTSAATANKSNDKGTYLFAFTNVTAGDYTIKPFGADGSALTGSSAVTFTGVDNEIAIPRNQGIAGLDSATQAQIDAIEIAIEEIQTSFTEATVTVTGYASIDTDGVLQLKRAETATLTFTSDSANLVPDLSAGTTKIVMGIKDTAGRVWLSLTGTVLVATGLQSVRFVLTPTLSLALIKGHHNFDVLAIYGYDAGSTPPYASLKTFTSGRVTVTDVYLDPLGL